MVTPCSFEHSPFINFHDGLGGAGITAQITGMQGGNWELALRALEDKRSDRHWADGLWPSLGARWPLSRDSFSPLLPPLYFLPSTFSSLLSPLYFLLSTFSSLLSPLYFLLSTFSSLLSPLYFLPSPKFPPPLPITKNTPAGMVT